MNSMLTGPPLGARVASSRWQVPRLSADGRWLGGVAAAIAREIGVQPLVIRAAFVVLASVGGWGLVFYAVAWGGLAVASSRQTGPYVAHPKAATPAHRIAAVVLITLGLVVGLLPLTSTVFAIVVWPVGFIMSGILIAWTRAEDGGVAAVVRVVAGLVVALGGFIAFAVTQIRVLDAVIALMVAAAVISGVTVVAAPSVVRMGRELDHERLQRTRSDERARINAHVHDSVLQTLTLIQQQSDDPARTRQLARRQERELRNWLYATPASEPHGLRLGPALEHAAAEVEDDADVAIDVVTVGDIDDLDPASIAPLIAATREAMRNAAHHSGAPRVSVFAERRGNVVDVFIRDEGTGFDPDSVGDDRRGLAESVIGRMQRANGTATVHSAPGSGTEVELSLPVPTAAAPR